MKKTDSRCGYCPLYTIWKYGKVRKGAKIKCDPSDAGLCYTEAKAEWENLSPECREFLESIDN